jgi:hypothetical protein
MKNIKLTEDVLVQSIENQVVVVSPSSGMITTLNETGAFIIEYLINKSIVTNEELVDAISNEFNASKETISADVNVFLEEMTKHKIIE